MEKEKMQAKEKSNRSLLRMTVREYMNIGISRMHSSACVVLYIFAMVAIMVVLHHGGYTTYDTIGKWFEIVMMCVSVLLSFGPVILFVAMLLKKEKEIGRDTKLSDAEMHYYHNIQETLHCSSYIGVFLLSIACMADSLRDVYPSLISPMREGEVASFGICIGFLLCALLHAKFGKKSLEKKADEQQIDAEDIAAANDSEETKEE